MGQVVLSEVLKKGKARAARHFHRTQVQELHQVKSLLSNRPNLRSEGYWCSSLVNTQSAIEPGWQAWELEVYPAILHPKAWPGFLRATVGKNKKPFFKIFIEKRCGL